MSVVFDSSALLVIVFQEDGAEAAARRLGGGIVSVVNASEVIARLVGFGISGEDARNALLNFGLDIRPLDTVLAVAAGQLCAATREKGLSLGDHACVALAVREQAGIVTAASVGGARSGCGGRAASLTRGRAHPRALSPYRVSGFRLSAREVVIGVTLTSPIRGRPVRFNPEHCLDADRVAASTKAVGGIRAAVL